ncbi:MULTISPECIES: NAD(P)/FAD-dependent oxidoreductase [unclassified Helicobacter]|uniref:NAD(P)/FAD-dependent oxidoreductase n=1 Tax=unclassified Helicobacter TaxID=2593540 RepID=UPI000CF0C7E9|nr:MULTISPECIES: NAD(P)/FAD-dependent oxidoreductase [unclassified Helicobacter]
MSQKIQKILIIGGGYGGLKAALTLQKRNAKADITLISKHDYHYQTTLLHKVAIGTLSEKKAKIYYRSLLNNVRFVKDKVMEIRPQENKIVGKLDNYEYDVLVLGLGFKPDDFGIKGVKENTYKLSSLNAALKLSKHIERKFKNYHLTKDKNELSFIVCGAGFTSIEFTAELAHEIKKYCQNYGLSKEDISITCVGRSSRILPVFDEKLSQLATQKLEDLGVKFITSATVEECHQDGVIITKDGHQEKIYGNTVLWGTGVKGNDTVEYYSPIHSNKGRLKVDSKLKSIDYDNMYVVGDCAIYAQKEVVHVPTAQLATQMGEYVGNLLADKLEGKTSFQDFRFINRGSICSIGHTDAVGVVFGKRVSGKFGAFMKNLVENRWLFGIGGVKMVLKKGQFRCRSSD